MQEVRQKSWFGRNWIWVLPVGGCFTLIVTGLVFFGTLFFGITEVFKNTAPYAYALEQASHNEAVIAFLGENIESDGLISGNISYENDYGHADFSIPIKGSKGKGRVFILAKKRDGKWFYEALYVIIKETGERINLLAKTLEVI